MAYPQTYETAVALLKGLPKDARIVDLGCGAGQVVKMLRATGFKHIEYADLVDRFDGKVTIANFNNPLPFKSDTYDAVISTEVIEHLENKYLYLREVRRILKKDGVYVFSTPNIGNLFNRLKYLLTGKFIEFNKHEHDGNSHVNPFFMWQVPDFFKVERVTVNRGWIPLLRMPMPKSLLLGQCLIIRVRVLK
ncbi:MAG: class I SAM-dependent methyltransferase [Nanoarchaeota archaeon]|nr:class I SAM-dependent methyltransferase [Nanoarchaeota archaeon]